MDSWIFQGGHPLIRAELVHDEFGEAPAQLRLRQQRFGYAGDIGEGDDASREQDPSELAAHWAAPVILSQSSHDVVTFEKVLLDADDMQVELIDPLDWVLVNTEGTGFYRVAYERDLREALVARRPGRPVTHRALRAGRRRLGRGAGRSAAARSSSWRWPASSRLRTTCRCGGA